MDDKPTLLAFYREHYFYIVVNKKDVELGWRWTRSSLFLKKQNRFKESEEDGSHAHYIFLSRGCVRVVVTKNNHEPKNLAEVNEYPDSKNRRRV